MCSSVSASKPENTSSKIINSFLAYTALASATRCFWPPLNEIPAFPTSVAGFLSVQVPHHTEDNCSDIPHRYSSPSIILENEIT